MVGTLCDSLRSIVAHDSSAPAVIARDRTLSYPELIAEAAGVAAALRERGIGRGQLVGVLLERDSHLVPSLLGVLLAGAAYVPLDPAYPPARIATILDDSRPSLVISVPALAQAHRESLLRTPWIPPSPPSHLPFVSAAHPGDLAYLIYTSGSTGRPKGVMIEHAAAADMLAWAAAEMPADSLCRVLASTSVCFDLSIFELFLPLSLGRTVVLEHSIVDWHERGCPHDVTLVNTVPSALATVVAAGGLPTSVSVVNVAGEPLPAALVDDTWRVHPWLAAMYNLYGPSEDTTYSTFTPVAAGLPVTIGRPLPNTRAYVVTEAGELIDGDEAGELWLAGAGLARGYMGQPALTAERFVADPYATEPGARAYRTGDIVRRLPDGNLAYLGRLDDQVKIRGFRIEPGEVVARLTTHPNVQSAVVLAAVSPMGDARLLAYVRMRPDTPHDAGALVAHVRDTLPAYMCPQVIVWMDEWPLTANGKIDRRALPPPEWREGHSVRQPVSDLESAVLEAWRHVLGPGLGPDNDFFALGGDSLSAMRITAKVREATARPVSLDTIFRHPTVAAMAASLALPQTPKVESHAPVQAASAMAATELSFGEERLFFLQQLDPASPKYNMGYAWRFRGTLDVARFERAFAATVSRYATLSTGYVLDDEPRRVTGVHHAPWTHVRIASEDALRQYMDTQIQTPFDVAKPPLWRASLVERGDDDHVLVMVLHHAIADAWSIDMLARELAQAYERNDDNEPSAPSAYAYADYIAHQRALARAGHFHAHLAYWVARLRGAPELNLPVSSRRGDSAAQASGAMHRFTVPRPLVERLQGLRAREGVSTFMLLMAAWNTFLHRICGQDDICVAVPVSDRADPRFQGTFGYFLNTLVLRNDLSGNPSFIALLQRVRESTLEAFANQDIPFDDVVRVLEPVRDLRRTPLARTALVVQPEGPVACLLEGMASCTCEELFTPTAKFDISLFVTEQMPGVNGWWAVIEYDTTLFPAKTIDMLAGQWLALLDHLTTSPDKAIGDHVLAVAPDRGAAVDVSARRAAHARFVDQALRTPHAPALDYLGKTTTYAELEEQSRALALTLVERFGRGHVIALDVHDGPWLVVAIIGIARSGNAYMPVDPAIPAQRIAAMLAQSEPVAVVGTALLNESLHALPLVDVTELHAVPTTELPTVDAQGTLYVMHTSGSTGEPKGVHLPHRALDALVGWYHSALANGVRMPQLAPPYFDMASLEIFATLSGGGTLVMGDRTALREPDALADWLATQRIEQVYLPVVLLDLVARTWNRSGMRPSALREVVTAGEALVITPAIREFARLQGCLICNQYGPTETHVATACVLDPQAVDPEDWPERPPIGRPIDGTSCYVLDSYGHPCSPGIDGDLFIGGDGVALGYAKQPSLTAARFLPDPFASSPGMRMYRTGDRVRLDHDGLLHFLGREDRQVKIRGYRVEPGEIEGVLLSDPSVAQARVVMRNGSGAASGDSHLVAYIVASGTDNVRDWRRRVASVLPAHMVPARYVVIDALPLNANGKVDESRLPDPVLDERAAQANRTPTETRLAELWCGVLGLSQVGNDTHFFECGGNSFAAMRLVAAMHDAFGMRVPLHVVFTLPTVRECAAAIDERKAMATA